MYSAFYYNHFTKRDREFKIDVALSIVLKVLLHSYYILNSYPRTSVFLYYVGFRWYRWASFLSNGLQKLIEGMHVRHDNLFVGKPLGDSLHFNFQPL